MEKSFGYFFYLKKSKGYTAGLIPVYLRFIVNGVSCDISCKLKADHGKWNATAGRAEGKTDEAKTLNVYLDTVQQKVFDARRKRMERGEEISAMPA
jgi:hypothetical protein